MAHPLVLGLFTSPASAAAAARVLHDAGVTRDAISVITRNHDEDTVLARQMDASPGVDIEDSRSAGRLGELSGYVLAAIALVLPGMGRVVTAGPLAAGLGEAAGHVAGGVAAALTGAGLTPERAAALQDAVHNGAILLAVHTTPEQVPAVRTAFGDAGAANLDIANWSE